MWRLGSCKVVVGEALKYHVARGVEALNYHVAGGVVGEALKYHVAGVRMW